MPDGARRAPSESGRTPPSGRDWLNLGSTPAVGGTPTTGGTTATGRFAANPWADRLRQSAGRTRSSLGGHWQPALAARIAPLRSAAERVGGRIGSHPMTREASNRWQRAAEAASRVPWGRLSLAALLLTIGLVLAILAWCAATLPSLADKPPTASPVTVQAQDGETLALRGDMRGRALAPGDIAPVMKRALIAAQDPWFEDVRALDATGIFSVVRGAFRETVGAGLRDGSARLTQLLVRRNLLAGERGFVPSVQEAMLVLWLEARASKDAILTRSLNTASFGPDLVGLDAAARRVLGKEARDLSAAEAALLAGLTLPPADLRADRDLDAARARARRVLDGMVMTGALSRAQADEAGRALAGLALPGATPATRSGLPDLAAAAAHDRLGGGFREATLRTSLDRGLQGMAEKAVERRLDANARRRGARAALVALGQDGAVLAVFGTGSPLAADEAGRASAQVSLRRIQRDGRPVFDRLRAPTLSPAALRMRAYGLLAALARPPEGDGPPGARDGFYVAAIGDMTVGVWFSGEDERTPEGSAGDAPEAIWQDFSAQVAKARPTPPEPPARESAREAGTRDAAARETAGPRGAWQSPEGKAAAPPLLRGTARVIDTGRLRIDGQTIRLVGVEGQGGRVAREFRQYLRKREVECDPAGEADVYRCRAGAQDLSEVVLFNGAGKAAPNAPPDLQAAEASAKARQAGVWQN
ncbi:transglycosylase domain-containing protein [Methylobacterium oryzisoli]|uniref:transglycosylase domain-containing protein n=1 Tax=Methylobacterium oryzisoli TaxID=3385502 RepID=UPI003891718D